MGHGGQGVVSQRQRLLTVLKLNSHVTREMKLLNLHAAVCASFVASVTFVVFSLCCGYE